jgi:2-polyprenyl-3-methyl-5-hydroxy-6-metoxy-1,4-benzoquinol methylase|tara:strand:- start:462 stop:1460 length:999 start_codon:yes stop_codon:yes gene_type:complete
MKKVFDFIDENRKAFGKIKQEEVLPHIDPGTNKVYNYMANRVLCPICSVDDIVWVFEKGGFDFVKCRHCGLLYVNPQLKADVSEAFYKRSKTSTAWIKVQQGEKEQDWNYRMKYFPALKELKSLKPQGGRLLDIGCSIGQFVKHSAKFGWQGEGVELNKEAVEFGRKEYGLKIYDKKLDELGLDGESYDLITLWGVLEHLTDPNKMLLDVNRLLKKDGLLLLFVPNGHSLIVRLSREHNSTVSGRSHLWYFTPVTISKILEKNGFKKKSEFSVLPQVHEIAHFMQYNILYKEPDMLCDEEFFLDDEEKDNFEQYINKNKLGYKLITIAGKNI